MLIQLKTKNAVSVMDGDSYTEKLINFYLTNLFISESEAPSDECLSYAKEFSNTEYSQDQIAFILFSSFGLSFTTDGELITHDSKSFDLAAKHIKYILSQKES